LQANPYGDMIDFSNTVGARDSSKMGKESGGLHKFKSDVSANESLGECLRLGGPLYTATEKRRPSVSLRVVLRYLTEIEVDVEVSVGRRSDSREGVHDTA
jgi:hypothetical protein